MESIVGHSLRATLLECVAAGPSYALALTDAVHRASGGELRPTPSQIAGMLASMESTGEIEGYSITSSTGVVRYYRVRP